MKINSLDSSINKVITSLQNSNGSENVSSDLGEEFSELIGQFFSGATINDNSELLKQIEKTTIATEHKEKAKLEKREENNNSEKKADSDQQKTEDHVISKKEEQVSEENIIQETKDTTPDVARVVNAVSQLKNEELKVEDSSVSEFVINKEPAQEQQQKQANKDQAFSDAEVEVDQNNYLQNNKAAVNVRNQTEHNFSKEQTQNSATNTIEDPATKDLTLKSIKKIQGNEEKELPHDSALDLNNQNIEGNLQASALKQNSETAISKNNASLNLSAQMLQATTVAELSAQKSPLKANVSSGNLDIAGINNNQGIDKSNLAKIKQSLTSSLPRYSEKTLEKVKELLAQAAQNRDGNSLTLKLNPKELGQITVKVTQRDNNIYARITPDSSEIESILRDKAGELTQVLIQAGIKSEQLHVSIGQERTETESFKFSEFLNGQDSSRQNSSFSDKSKEEGRENAVVKNVFNNQTKTSNIDLGWVA